MAREFVNIESNKGMLRGMLHYPYNYEKGNKYGIVVVNYGINGNRSDFHSILCDLAIKLSKIGFFCLRFDYYGLGTSDGFFYECDVNTKTEDSLNVFEYVYSKEDVDKEKIYTLTYSDGIQIMLEACMRNHKYAEQKFIFWSPFIIQNDDANGQSILFKPQKARDGHTIVIPFGSTWISLSYLQQKRKTKYDSMLKCLENSIGNIKYYYAADDPVVLESLRVLEQFEFFEEIKIKCGGHCFCDYNGHREVIEKTIQGIEKETICDNGIVC